MVVTNVSIPDKENVNPQGDGWAGCLYPVAGHEANSSLELASLNVGQIRLIHRGNDGFVTFSIKVGELWLEVGGVRASDLEQMFPEFQHALTADSYFSINSMYGAGRCQWLEDGTRQPYLHQQTGLPDVKRGKAYVRYLNACFTDLDWHGDNFDYAWLHGEILRAQDAGLIPPASIIARSGRGAWLLWLLRDLKDDGPQRAWPERLEQWCRIQRAIQQRLASLGSDRNALDPARVTRIPGSLNSAAKPGSRVVTYSLQADQRGTPFIYNLEELAEWFGVRNKSLVLTQTKAKDPRKALAWRARWRYAWEHFWILESRRGGFQQGHRYKALKIMVFIGKRLGFADRELGDFAGKLAKSFRPTYPATDTKRKISELIEWAGKSKSWKYKNETFAQELEVTSEEASYVPRWVKAEKVVESAAAKRQRVLREIASELGSISSVRKMRKLLEERGIKASQGTISYDLHSLKEAKHPLSPSLSTSARRVEHLYTRTEQQATDATERRNSLAGIVSGKCGGCLPPLRTLSGMLAEEGFVVSHVTVSNDLRALKLRPMAVPPQAQQQSLFGCTASLA